MSEQEAGAPPVVPLVLSPPPKGAFPLLPDPQPRPRLQGVASSSNLFSPSSAKIKPARRVSLEPRMPIRFRHLSGQETRAIIHCLCYFQFPFPP
jgi:hypothetical protein